MKEILLKVIYQTFEVAFFVFLMMIVVDVINTGTKGKLAQLFSSGRQWRQYVVASLIGTTPGCVGAFTVVSLYVHGIVSFGALVGSLAAASGDEAFVMLKMFPKTALVLFGMLFVIGAVTGWVTDLIMKKWNIKTCQDCKFQEIHPVETSLGHYFKDHIWGHIVKRHLARTLCWTFGAILLVELGTNYWNLGAMTSNYPLLLLFSGALIGLIPESGPHLFFVTMYADGLIPFSVLFTSTFVQDGHGLLPMLSYSVRDSLLLKGFNLVFGLSIGLLLYLAGW